MTTTQINLTFEDGCAVSFAFSEQPALSLSFAESPSLSFDVGTIVLGGIDDYEGEYVSKPCSTVQVYGTTDKRMTDDFTVLEIPVYRADNEDGVTVTIAES